MLGQQRRGLLIHANTRDNLLKVIAQLHALNGANGDRFVHHLSLAGGQPLPTVEGDGYERPLRGEGLPPEIDGETGGDDRHQPDQVEAAWGPDGCFR